MIKFARLFDNAIVPHLSREGDAGFDLYAINGGYVQEHATTIVHTGIAVEIPQGYVGLLVPRSGLAYQFGIGVVNAPGIIDSNFRGELKVMLTKHTLGGYRFGAGDRIAQLVVVPCVTASTEVEPDELSTTNRGPNGFGSSGT